MKRPAPTATPTTVWISLVLALVPIALAVVLVRDLAVTQGWATGTSWTTQLVDDVDSLSASAGVSIVGGVVAVLGLLLLITALRPARRTHVSLDTEADAWITPRAVAALARAVADRSAGVLEARTDKVSPRKVRILVTAAPTVDRSGTARTAQQDVDTALGDLTTSRPSVTVRAAAGAAS